jgi:WhiB family redox-sensing transcriptional regulator
LQGSCRDYSVGTFFPDAVRGEAWLAAVDLAKRICRSCPVIEDCRDFAVQTQERWGIWGALTPAERTALRRGGRLVFERGATDPEAVASPGVFVAPERADIDVVTR